MSIVCGHLFTSIFFFFFSSRRRHTRCLSDWSSDVCSSDHRKSTRLNSGITNTTGNNNVYIGAAAGVLANPAATQNVYLATQGAATESNTTALAPLTHHPR